MTTKPEALRLADWLDAEACGGSNWNAKMNAAAAELRRLHAQRDALLDLLKEARKIIRASSSRNLVKGGDQRTTAAIKAVEEGK